MYKRQPLTDANVLVIITIGIIFSCACAGLMGIDDRAINADILHIRLETHYFEGFLQSIAFAHCAKPFIYGLPACHLSRDIAPRRSSVQHPEHCIEDCSIIPLFSSVLLLCVSEEGA